MIKLTCPSCEVRLQVDENRLPKRARCPKCHGLLSLTDPPSPPAEADDQAPERPARKPLPGRPRPRPRDPADDEDERTKKEATSDRKEPEEAVAWRKVRLGLLLQLILSASRFASIILLIIGFSRGSFGFFGLFWYLSVPLALLGVAGHILLASAPNRYASRTSMYVVIGIDVLSVCYLVAFLFLFILPAFSNRVPHSLTFFLLSAVPVGLLFWLQFFLHRTFLKEIAKAMEVTQAEYHFDTMVKWQLLPSVVWLAAPVVGRIPGAFPLLLVVTWLFGLASLLLYMHVHILLRASIADHLRHLRPRRKRRKGKSTGESDGDNQ
jgi:hypothetical protein